MIAPGGRVRVILESFGILGPSVPPFDEATFFRFAFNPKRRIFMANRLWLALLSVVIFSLPSSAETPSRSVEGLEVLFDFGERGNGIIENQAIDSSAVSLKVADQKTVTFADGRILLKGTPRIESIEPPKAMVQAIKDSGEVTIEAWVEAVRRDQAGPARILSLSSDSSNRNFTLGQDGDRFDFRLRTSKTGVNGIPSLASPAGSLQTALQHVVYTHSRNGQSRFYVDGNQVADRVIKGGLSNWDETFRLRMGDEKGGGRPWIGSVHLIAIYRRSLDASEISKHYAIGPIAKTVEETQRNISLRLFDKRIASILSNHCLECHDPSNNEGGLDLSRERAVVEGGDSGPVVIPGDAEGSELWQVVKSDRMPHNRDALDDDEKDSLKQWIQSGAHWSIDMIDPAIYLHEDTSGQQWVQRLTVGQYIRTVRDTLGVDIANDARRTLPPDLRADGFRNTAYNLNIDLKHIEAYAGLAERTVELMDVEAFAKRFSGSRKLTDDNMRKLIAEMGQWVLRGPLEPHEIDLYRGISTTVASAGGQFRDAVRYVLQAMLQSPRFIYRIERQPEYGPASVGDFELASRISYILWGSSPDVALLDAADEGKLGERLTAHIDRMLTDDRAAEQASEFISQWLNLDRLKNLSPDPSRFPKWSPILAADMKAETLAFFDDVAWVKDEPLRKLLNAQSTFATERLARHYRLKGARQPVKQRLGSDDVQWYRYDLKTEPARGGLLTQGSVLTIGGDDASMVSRGLFLLHDLLRGVVNDPPPCVDTTPVPTREGLSQRLIATQRVENTACGGCHKRFEPLAFGLERFDGLGTFQPRDRFNNPLREDGTIRVPGQADPIEYQTTAEMLDQLADSDRVQESICWKLSQFAIGRPLTAADAATMRNVYTQSSEAGGSYRDVIKAIVLSDLVRKTQP